MKPGHGPGQNDRDWDGSWQRQDAQRLIRQQAALPVRRLREALAAVLPPPGFRALELGAGGSAWLPFLAGRGAWAAGLDLSVPGLLLSRELLAASGAEAHLVRGDVLKAPFGDGFFDVVFSAGLVEHFADSRDVLRQALRLLRPGGLCITSVPNKLGLPGLLDSWLNPATFAGHVRYTPASLAEQHSLVGFEVLSARYVGSFSLGARAPERGFLRLPYRICRKALTAVVWGSLDLLKCYPESRSFSPAVLVVARRPVEVGTG